MDERKEEVGQCRDVKLNENQKQGQSQDMKLNDQCQSQDMNPNEQLPKTKRKTIADFKTRFPIKTSLKKDIKLDLQNTQKEDELQEDEKKQEIEQKIQPDTVKETKNCPSPKSEHGSEDMDIVELDNKNPIEESNNITVCVSKDEQWPNEQKQLHSIPVIGQSEGILGQGHSQNIMSITGQGHKNTETDIKCADQEAQNSTLSTGPEIRTNYTQAQSNPGSDVLNYEACYPGWYQGYPCQNYTYPMNPMQGAYSGYGYVPSPTQPAVYPPLPPEPFELGSEDVDYRKPPYNNCQQNVTQWQVNESLSGSNNVNLTNNSDAKR